MFDATIHAKTIGRQICRSDFHSKIWNFGEQDKNDVVNQALEIASSGFNAVTLRCNMLGGKPIYRHAALGEALLIRHISDSLRRVTKVRQSDRQSIIKSLVSLGSEGIAFNVVKMDIKSFYETLNVYDVISKLKSDIAFSRQSMFVIESFFTALENQGIIGLPRGIGLSATLSEYAMRKFDAEISGSSGVRFYSRYVDDATVITSDKVDAISLRDFAASQLPAGLSLNRNKTKTFQFKSATKAKATSVEHHVGFLGYRIGISKAIRDDNRTFREVHVDISPSKVLKIKRRISKSFLDYNNGGSFEDLLSRIKVLTSNYGFIDSSSGQKRYSGLRYNYSLIDPDKSISLSSLDRFISNALHSNHPGNRIKPNLSRDQKKKLSGFSFKAGFKTNRFFSFSYDDLQRIIGCWAHA